MPDRASRRQLLWSVGAGLGLAGLGAMGLRSHTWPGRRLRTFKRSIPAMGTWMAITVLHREEAVAQRAIDGAIAEIARLDRILSLYRPDSEISVLNRDGELRSADPSMIQILGICRIVSEKTGGAFDITVQPLWTLYAQAKKLGRLPDDPQVQAARAKVDWKKVELDGRRVRLAEAGMAITLNAIAQGYAADRIIAVLRAGEIENALVDAGELGAIGRREDGAVWTAGIKNPRNTSQLIAAVRMDGRYLATSGDYATTFSSDYSHHHIFNPASGRSDGDLASVSVMADTGAVADALATALMAMGKQRGLFSLRQFPGADVMMVGKNGAMTQTAGFPRV